MTETVGRWRRKRTRKQVFDEEDDDTLCVVDHPHAELVNRLWADGNALHMLAYIFGEATEPFANYLWLADPWLAEHAGFHKVAVRIHMCRLAAAVHGAIIGYAPRGHSFMPYSTTLLINADDSIGMGLVIKDYTVEFYNTPRLNREDAMGKIYGDLLREWAEHCTVPATMAVEFIRYFLRSFKRRSEDVKALAKHVAPYVRLLETIAYLQSWPDTAGLTMQASWKREHELLLFVTTADNCVIRVTFWNKYGAVSIGKLRCTVYNEDDIAPSTQVCLGTIVRNIIPNLGALRALRDCSIAMSGLEDAPPLFTPCDDHILFENHRILYSIEAPLTTTVAWNRTLRVLTVRNETELDTGDEPSTHYIIAPVDVKQSWAIMVSTDRLWYNHAVSDGAAASCVKDVLADVLETELYHGNLYVDGSNDTESTERIIAMIARGRIPIPLPLPIPLPPPTHH